MLWTCLAGNNLFLCTIIGFDHRWIYFKNLRNQSCFSVVKEISLLQCWVVTWRMHIRSVWYSTVYQWNSDGCHVIVLFVKVWDSFVIVGLIYCLAVGYAYGVISWCDAWQVILRQFFPHIYNERKCFTCEDILTRSSNCCLVLGWWFALLITDCWLLECAGRTAGWDGPVVRIAAFSSDLFWLFCSP
jgi:hypothetical protein